MAKIGYARVGTRDQHPDHQVDALRTAGCERVFVDTATGKLARRPQLDEALDHLRPGDALVITRLNRLGRSLRHLVELVAQLGERDVDLIVLEQGLDTTSPGGRLLYQVIAAIAEFEREKIVDGTLEGLTAARSQGRRGGRPPALSERQVSQARTMFEEVDEAGNRVHTMAEIADTFGVSRATVYRHLENAPAQASTPAIDATASSAARPPADYVPYGERRPYLVADSLAELTGPTTGVVELPKRLNWSGSPSYDLDTPGRLASMYKTVLAEATRVDDLRTWLHGERLMQLWPQLLLPPKVRRLWEDRFPELAAARAAASVA